MRYKALIVILATLAALVFAESIAETRDGYGWSYVGTGGFGRDLTGTYIYVSAANSEVKKRLFTSGNVNQPVYFSKTIRGYLQDSTPATRIDGRVYPTGQPDLTYTASFSYTDFVFEGYSTGDYVDVVISNTSGNTIKVYIFHESGI